MSMCIMTGVQRKRTIARTHIIKRIDFLAENAWKSIDRQLNADPLKRMRNAFSHMMPRLRYFYLYTLAFEKIKQPENLNRCILSIYIALWSFDCLHHQFSPFFFYFPHFRPLQCVQTHAKMWRFHFSYFFLVCFICRALHLLSYAFTKRNNSFCLMSATPFEGQMCYYFEFSVQTILRNCSTIEEHLPFC